MGEQHSLAGEGVGEKACHSVYSLASVVELKEYSPSRGRPEFGRLFLLLGYEYEAAKLRWAGGAQRPVLPGNVPKKTGARSARARTRGQNPLVNHIFI
jgi:hypothetical protein